MNAIVRMDDQSSRLVGILAIRASSAHIVGQRLGVVSVLTKAN